MIMMMMRFQFLQTPMPNLLALLLLTMIALATSQYDFFSIAKPSCHDHCGNIPIPFPFGTTLHCYHSHPFRVTCNRTFKPPKLFWGNSSIEIISISLLGQMTIMQHVSYNCDCGNGNKVSSPGSKLQLPEPFTVNNTANKFTIVGHDAYGFVYGLQQSGQQYSVGCMTKRYSVSDLEEGSCMGLDCCQTSIPKNVSGVNINLNIERNNTSNCTYGFLVEESAFNFSRKSVADLKDVKMLPMVVDWAVGLNRTCQEARKRPSEYACTSENSLCYMPENGNGYRCLCRNGYHGNPYFTHGCYQDDDERAFYNIAYSIIGSLLVLYWVWKCGHAIKANRRYTFYKRNGGLLLEQHISSTENRLHKIKVFTSKELAQATDHYNENCILGRGGQGTVYKGMLTDGKIVAVKKSSKVKEGDVEVFINEVVILSQINHRNIVNLIGCCLETEVPLLVYEFILNGTLFHHIHEPSEEIPLTWEMRVRIATEVAGALSYLHSASSTPIYHRDIKSTNILLDDKYRAKVSDFGTSRSVSIDQTHLTTRVLGTFGYLDPEYFQSSQFTEKSDVYSFGVVMVELLTGEEAVTSVRAESGKNLATHFLHTMKDGKLFDILDARVLKEGKTKDIVGMAEIARRCLNMNGRKRPTMKEVGVDLEGIQRELLEEGRVSPQRNDHNIDMNREIEISNESYDISLNFSRTYTDSIIGDSREPKSH